jgi:hypothetical protein
MLYLVNTLCEATIKVTDTYTFLLIEKQTRLTFHVSVKIAKLLLELGFYVTGNLNDVIINLYLNK